MPYGPSPRCAWRKRYPAFAPRKVLTDLLVFRSELYQLLPHCIRERRGPARMMDVVLSTGTQPPDPGTPERIVAALAELTKTAADPRIRYAADYLRYELGRHIGWP